MTGALIGFAVGEPVVAVPAAVISHYICDAIPHYDDNRLSKAKWIATNKFRNLLIVDALLCVTLVGVLAFKHPVHWLLAAVCAFAATAPDMLNIGIFRQAITKQKIKDNWYHRWNLKWQWFQRPIGWVVEVAWFAGTAVLLAQFLG